MAHSSDDDSYSPPDIKSPFRSTNDAHKSANTQGNASSSRTDPRANADPTGAASSQVPAQSQNVNRSQGSHYYTTRQKIEMNIRQTDTYLSLMGKKLADLRDLRTDPHDEPDLTAAFEGVMEEYRDKFKVLREEVEQDQVYMRFGRAKDYREWSGMPR